MKEPIVSDGKIFGPLTFISEKTFVLNHMEVCDINRYLCKTFILNRIETSVMNRYLCITFVLKYVDICGNRYIEV